MIVLQSIDAEGNPSWSPVPEGYTVERAIEILSFAGHTEVILKEVDLAA